MDENLDKTKKLSDIDASAVSGGNSDDDNALFPSINAQACNLCMVCVKVCPHGVLDEEHGRPFYSPVYYCQKCSAPCVSQCPQKAIRLTNNFNELMSQHGDLPTLP